MNRDVAGKARNVAAEWESLSVTYLGINLDKAVSVLLFEAHITVILPLPKEDKPLIIEAQMRRCGSTLLLLQSTHQHAPKLLLEFGGSTDHSSSTPLMAWSD